VPNTCPYCVTLFSILFTVVCVPPIFFSYYLISYF
jgi:hypothetical protein